MSEPKALSEPRGFGRSVAVLVVLGLLGEVLALAGVLESTFAGLSPTDDPFLASALGASALVFAATSRSLREVLAVSVVGGIAAGALVVARLVPTTSVRTLLVLATTLGAAALVVAAVSWARRRAPDSRSRLLAMVLIPLFAFVSLRYLRLTAILWPTTLDGALYGLDATFGFQPSFAMGRSFRAWPIFASIASSTYFALPLGFALVYGLHRRRGSASGGGVITPFLLVAAVGYALYFVFPVAGPVYAFPEAYPGSPPDAEMVRSARSLVAPVARNCVPSLHTAWALLVWWHSRGLPPWARIVCFLFLAMTLAATLGLGFHYLWDLVIALPVTLTVHALTSTEAPAFERSRALRWGALLMLACLALIPRGYEAMTLSRFVPWTIAAAVVVTVFALERTMWVRGARPVEVAATAPPAAPDRRLAALAGIFFSSGFAALVYQVVFAKGLALTFGSTAHAATVVLATYMMGLALGSFFGGRLAQRTENPVRAYALAEVGIGVWCLMAPVLLDVARAAYVAVATGTDPAATRVLALQVALGAALLVPPTFLMGLTLPLLAARFLRSRASLGSAAGLLYGMNTLGAALGAVLTGYWLLPTLGVLGSLLAAVAVNFAVALVAMLLSRGAPRAGVPVESSGPSEHETTEARRLGRVAVAMLAIGGVVTFGLETAFIHLLAVVAGNSTYAFSLMLFTFLVGLGGGSAVGRRLVERGGSVVAGLAAAALGLGVTVMGGVHLWEAIPDYFGSFAPYSETRTFAAREFVRFVVCLVAMLPPATCIGVLFPVAMECVGRGWPRTRVRALGVASALNTAGNIGGALLTGFVLLPGLGSLRTLHVMVALTMASAALTLVVARGRTRLAVAGGVAACGLLLAAQPRQFDLTRLASGANVYFASTYHGEVVDHAESLDGGLTTVNVSRDGEGRTVHTMLTNGKFQGDDSPDREVRAQSAFALCPLLHTDARGRALVIGLGTGNSARVLSDAGFAELDVAELSADVVRMASAHFSRANGGVLNRAGVGVHVTDGRNFLLLTQRQYDLVGIEIASIWFAGAASLYNVEFYRLVRARLRPEGVLQQWVQLHRLSGEDVVSILASVRTEFDKVWLYFLGNQGVIVACNGACEPRDATLARLDGHAPLGPTLALFGGTSRKVLEGRLLTPAGVDYLIAQAMEAGTDERQLISSDDNLRLEYSTPRGNVRPYWPSLRANVEFLAQYRPPSPLAGTSVSPERPGR